MTIDPSIRLRTAEPADVTAISDIVRAAYAKWVPLIGREPMPMRADYAKALLDHEFDLAVEDDRIVGLIETALEDDHLWIENVCVSPQAQGRGIGRLLLELAERKAIEAGRPELRLLTNGAFEANIALYKRYGYVVDKVEEFMNGTTVYMNKRLVKSPA